MKWNLTWLEKQKNGEYDFDETLKFPREVFKNISTINELGDVHVYGHGCYDSQKRQLLVDYTIKGKMILPCARSLEDVDYPFSIETSATFAFYKPSEEEYELIEAKKDTADLTPVVFQEIMVAVPMRVVKKGASVKTSGKGWKVIDESEIKEKEEDDIDPRLAVLQDYFKDKDE